MDYFRVSIDEHMRTFESLMQISDKIKSVAVASSDALKNGNKLIFCGNGGSAADAQHIAAEFTGRFVNDRVPLAALALTTDTSALTCIGNDYGFDEIFTRQIKALGKPGDVVFLITTSGNSNNIKNIIEVADKMKITTVALTGQRGCDFAASCDFDLIVNSRTTARIQEAHIFLLHVLCGLVEKELGYA